MVAARLRRELRRQVPVIVLTGQLSAETLGEIARQDTVRLNKPIRLDQLVQVIARLLPQLLAAPEGAATAPTLQHLDRQSASVRDGLTPPVIFIVDDDPDLCDAVRTVFEQEGRIVRTFATAEAYLAAGAPPAEGCLLIDAYLPGMSGLDLLRHLVALAHHLPCIMITGSSDVKMAVDAMKSGASDFIEKPVAPAELLRAVARALDQAHDSSKVAAWHEEAAGQLRHLTQRQLQIMEMVLAGHPSKNIAADLGISQRTVENHRAAIMKKTGSKSIPALARLALAASSLPQDRAGAPEMSETLPRAKAYQNGK
jgi:two-component system CheB/CheR fusion protein